MTVYDLMYYHKRNFPSSHFFDHDTLKFFGERISEMRVLQRTTTVRGRECYVLSSFQHNAPIPRRAYHYFATDNFEEVIRI